MDMSIQRKSLRDTWMGEYIGVALRGTVEWTPQSSHRKGTRQILLSIPDIEPYKVAQKHANFSWIIIGARTHFWIPRNEYWRLTKECGYPKCCVRRHVKILESIPLQDQDEIVEGLHLLAKEYKVGNAELVMIKATFLPDELPAIIVSES